MNRQQQEEQEAWASRSDRFDGFDRGDLDWDYEAQQQAENEQFLQEVKQMSKFDMMKEVVEAAACNLIDAEASSDYSGRCMFGRVCPSITTSDSVGRVMRAVIDAAGELGYAEKLYDVIDGISSDSMGLDKVYYWPLASRKDEG